MHAEPADDPRPRFGPGGTLRSRWPRILALGFGALLLLAALAAAGLYAWIAAVSPITPTRADLRQVRNERPSVMVSSDGVELTAFKRVRQEHLTLAQVSPNAVDALIATEDHRFREHRGVDWRRTVASVFHTLAGEPQGGSTITQQLVRNLFPEEIGRERSIQRKLREIITALRIERLYGKDEILETYLNRVDFLYNAVGIEAAAHTYVDKPASALDVAEAATLVGMLEGTSTYNPVLHPERAKARRNVVLAQMVNGKVWKPTDMSGASQLPMSLRDWLTYSKNTITAQVMQEVGAARVVVLAKAMGVDRSKLDPVPSLALGTSDVTLLEMVTGYATIAREGQVHAPVFVSKILDRDAKVLASFGSETRRALNADAALDLTDMLRGVVARGTGTQIRSKFGLSADLAGKTGTTQNNTDGWFILMQPQLVAGAWVGFNDTRVTLRSNHWGQGGHNAILLVGDFYRAAYQAGLLDPKFKFAPPSHPAPPPAPAVAPMLPSLLPPTLPADGPPGWDGGIAAGPFDASAPTHVGGWITAPERMTTLPSPRSADRPPARSRAASATAMPMPPSPTCAGNARSRRRASATATTPASSASLGRGNVASASGRTTPRPTRSATATAPNCCAIRPTLRLKFPAASGPARLPPGPATALQCQAQRAVTELRSAHFGRRAGRVPSGAIASA